MFRPISRTSLFVSVTMLPTLASAAVLSDTIRMNRDITYESDQIGTAIVRETCDWKDNFLDAVTRYSKGRVTITDGDLKSFDGKKLLVVITNVHTAGGGGYSGAKWLHARATVWERDTLIASNLFTRTTTVGGFTACSTLQKLGKSLGASIGKWSRSGFRSEPKESEPDVAPAEESAKETEEEKAT